MEPGKDQAQLLEMNIPTSNDEATTPKHTISDDSPAAEPAAKKLKLDGSSDQTGDGRSDRQKGVAPVKAEYV